MEATSTATSAAPRRDSALLNQSLDDIIKQNRSTRRKDLQGKKKTPATVGSNDQKNINNGRNKRNANRNGKRNDKDAKMMDTTPIGNNVQKHRAGRRNDSRDTPRVRDGRDNGPRGNLVIRSNSGRAPGPRRSPASAPSASRSGTAGLRQPWEKLPAAPLPSEPLKISIRNELAEKPARRSDMMDTDDAPCRPAFNASAASYEPRDALASREEYRIGNRFSTQGMAIDYQLPSGASFDTRPTRRY